MFEQEKIIVESAWEQRELLAKDEVREVIRRIVEAVDKGVLRCAEPIDLENSKWQVNEWVKKAIIMYFPIQSQFSWKSGMGYFFSSGQSSSASPCPLRTASLNSSPLTGRSVSVHTHSLWQRSEGTRTHMALTWQSVCMIFLVSLYIFISSFV